MLTVPSKKYGTLLCAAGYVVTDQLGTKYLTVPGHCHLDFTCLEDIVVDQLPDPLPELLDGVVPCIDPSDSEQEPVYSKTKGPVVKDADGNRVGVIVYAVNKQGIDFALVRVDAGVAVDPAIPLYGGPTSASSASSTGDEAYVFNPYSPYFANAHRGVLYVAGDSIFHEPGGTATAGAPVVKPDGAGVGYLSGTWMLPYGMEVLTYPPGFARAKTHARLDLKVVTAKVK
jgi:hypothetical protein